MSRSDRTKQIKKFFLSRGLSLDDAMKARLLAKQCSTEGKVRQLCQPVKGGRALAWPHIRLLVGLDYRDAKKFSEAAVTNSYSALQLSRQLRVTRKILPSHKAGRALTPPLSQELAILRLVEDADRLTRICQQWFGVGSVEDSRRPRGRRGTLSSLRWLLPKAIRSLGDLQKAARQVRASLLELGDK